MVLSSISFVQQAFEPETLQKIPTLLSLLIDKTAYCHYILAAFVFFILLTEPVFNLLSSEHYALPGPLHALLLYFVAEEHTCVLQEH